MNTEYQFQFFVTIRMANLFHIKLKKKTVFSFEEDSLLVSSILNLSDAGLVVNKFEIRRIVENDE
jgi:hypothetical protein